MGRIESRVTQPYQVVSTLTGTGTNGTMTKWTGGSTLGDSSVTEAQLAALVAAAAAAVPAASSGSTTIANNQSSSADVTGLTYFSGREQQVIIEYDIRRVTDTGGSELRAIGQLDLVYSRQDGTWYIGNNEWSGDTVAVSGVDSPAGVRFSVTSGGQLQYTSSSVAGANYVGDLDWYYRRTFLTSPTLPILNTQTAANFGISLDVRNHRTYLFEFEIFRQTDTALSEAAASGYVIFAYNSDTGLWATLGQGWAGDDPGVVFSITTAGVVQYTSSTIAGSNYQGICAFGYRTFDDSSSAALTVANNTAVATDIGLSLSPSTYRGAIIEWEMRRKTATGGSEVRSTGVLIYCTRAGSWESLSDYRDGDVMGVTFSMTTLGALQFTSTNIAGASYEGTMNYYLRSINV